MSSKPKKLHPELLTEPNVEISLYSALVIKPPGLALAASGKTGLADL